MSRRGGTGGKAAKKPVVVLAGEDRNDRLSLRILLEAVCPHMRGRIVEINDPVRLRSASGSNLSGRVNTLARKIRARAVRENADVACVFVHEDLDAVDGEEYPRVHSRVEQALRSSLGTAHYVLAVAEMEAWLLLFPAALKEFVASWQIPARRIGRDTGKLANPKKILMTEVSKGSGRRYTESDAPEVFRQVVDGGHLGTPQGANTSWSRFRADADLCGRRHIRVAGK